MSSLKLQTTLRQQMVLTPQLRQRIEMLQMTSMELSELIQNEMVANPVLEEVQPDEEFQEISEKILDQNSDGNDQNYEVGHEKNLDFGSQIENQQTEISGEIPSENGFQEETS